MQTDKVHRVERNANRVTAIAQPESRPQKPVRFLSDKPCAADLDELFGKMSSLEEGLRQCREGMLRGLVHLEQAKCEILFMSEASEVLMNHTSDDELVKQRRNSISNGMTNLWFDAMGTFEDGFFLVDKVSDRLAEIVERCRA